MLHMLHAAHAAYYTCCEFRGHQLCASGTAAPHDEAMKCQICRPVPYNSSLLTAEAMLRMQSSTQIWFLVDGQRFRSSC